MKSNGLHDFVSIYISKDKYNREVYEPTFEIKSNTKDLMIRGKKFYAIYNPKTSRWDTDINVAMELIDEETWNYVEEKVGKEIMANPQYAPTVKRIVDTKNGLSKKFRNFCEVDMEDHFTPLNQVVKFSNSGITREDYVSCTLSYPLQPGSIQYYEKLVNHLYLPDERQKIEWMIGALLAGDQGKIQKFFVFFGEPGSGKSTIIDKVIVDTIFDGKNTPYTAKFTAELLVNKNDFGTDFLTSDPIFAYDNDADLSRVDSKTTLNMIVSHERVRVNAKFARVFWTNPKCFLVCGTNEPVQLSPKSGFIRRLIDIRPTGETLPVDEYDECIDHLQFEKSGIAYHCLEVYKKLGKNFYNHYIPEDMLSQTSPFHNFVKDQFLALKNGISLSNAYKLYLEYVEETNLKSSLTRYKFRDSLKLYFDDYISDTGASGKAAFQGFKYEKIGLSRPDEPNEEVKEQTWVEEKKDETISWLKFNKTTSLFDDVFKGQPAQYATADGSPTMAWATVSTTLGDLDTSREHYVQVPTNVITIDFDLKDEDGNKSFDKNYEAARKFPPTYAELSKSGAGIHLTYIYTGGDPEKLSSLYGDNIEVKVQKGNSALRRKLTWCNELPISEISSGLPLKEAKKKMVDWDGFKKENVLYVMICRNLAKEYHSSTKSSIDYIDYILRQAYESGATYDLRKLYQPVFEFARKSTHKADYCEEKVTNMHFVSDDILEKERQGYIVGYEKENTQDEEYKNAPLVIFDIESYPEEPEKNLEALLVICWKYYGQGKPVTALVNPTPAEVKELFNYRLVGFNNRDYDNHILYARSQGFSIAECNRLSQRIINAETSEEKRRAKFGEAYNISYTDIYDFAAAGNKKGLKKWEIELGIHHQEMGIPWDKAVPKELWPKVVEYCTNDVLATEAVFDHLHGDFVAREILSELSGLTPNDTTNSHTVKILVGDIQDPQKDYIYTDLSTIFPGYQYNSQGIDKSLYKPGVKIVKGKSIYKGIDPGEGGRKIGYEGMYTNVGLFDVSSMHPSSAIRLQIFGPEITKRFEAIVKGRIAIKHKDYDLAISLLGDKVKKYLTGDPEELKKNAKNLANALKTAINSVYGLTSASFNNKLRDPRNVDNIVAKYGALFMIDLEEDLTNMGYKVVHVSTDSIKVANVDDKVAEYITRKGKAYGYEFEYEALYSRMCLVNDAVYIAKFANEEECKSRIGFVPEDNADAIAANKLWSATGAQFAVPYVYKTCFSHEPIVFSDMCETKNVQEGAIYLDFNESLDDSSYYDKALKKIVKVGPIPTRSEAALIKDLIAEFGLPENASIQLIQSRLDEKIASCHDYQFIGKIGQFTPILPGHGGGVLTRIKEGKVGAVTGTKKADDTPYRWLESETMTPEDQGNIDRSYYRALVDDARSSIEKYGDYEWFVSDGATLVPEFMNKPE